MGNARGREVTPEVRAMGELHYYGDCIAHSWSKHVGTWHDMKRKNTDEIKRVWRSRSFAQRLLARVVLMYKPVPVQREGTGEFIGWRRRFKGRYWRIDFAELAREFGCSARTLYDELALLRALGLVTTHPVYVARKEDGTKRSPLYVVPVVARIIRITEAPRVIANEETSPVAGEETSLAATEETSVEPVKKLQPSYIPSFSPETFSPEEGERATRAAPAPDSIPVPDALKNQPAPPRKRAPKFSPANITASDDPRIATYLELLRGEITPSNAALICQRVNHEHISEWREVCIRWAANAWNPINFSGMFDAHDRACNAQRVQAIHGAPKAKARAEQPQQFGVGGEWYEAARSLGWDLSEIQQEVSIGN